MPFRTISLRVFGPLGQTMCFIDIVFHCAIARLRCSSFWYHLSYIVVCDVIQFYVVLYLVPYHIINRSAVTPLGTLMIAYRGSEFLHIYMITYFEEHFLYSMTYWFYIVISRVKSPFITVIIVITTMVFTGSPPRHLNTLVFEGVRLTSLLHRFTCWSHYITYLCFDIEMV